MGQVVSKNPRTLSVNVFDSGNVTAVETAIRDFDPDVNPVVKDNLLTIQLVKVHRYSRILLLTLMKID